MRRTHLPHLLAGVLLLLTGCATIQQKTLFHPTHHHHDRGLTAWTHDGQTIGYAWLPPNPRNIWLMLHGNAGQAADRVYVLPRFSEHDAVFILEYPGYGWRGGKPSPSAFNAATAEGYQHLRRRFSDTPVCVVGESIGSGPACTLARQPQPPDKIVLVVPFDRLARVAAEYVPTSSAEVVMASTWDNADALATYSGPVDIFAARHDTIIPAKHAQALADQIPSATLHLIDGGHNDWALQGRVTIQNP